MDKILKWIGIGFCLWIAFNILPTLLYFLMALVTPW